MENPTRLNWDFMTMKLHQMQFPREVIVGNGTLERVVPICRKLGFSKSAFIVTGLETYGIAGRRVVDLLEDAGIEAGYLLVSSHWEDVAKHVPGLLGRPT